MFTITDWFDQNLRPYVVDGLLAKIAIGVRIFAELLPNMNDMAGSACSVVLARYAIDYFRNPDTN